MAEHGKYCPIFLTCWTRLAWRCGTMGQHKHNPTAIAAAKGELPPKKRERRLTKRQAEKAIAAENYTNNRPIPRLAGWDGRSYCRRYALWLIISGARMRYLRYGKPNAVEA